MSNRRVPPDDYETVREYGFFENPLTDAQLARWFELNCGEFGGWDEAELVRVMRNGLVTPSQQAEMNRLGITIEEMLNGRYSWTQEREDFETQCYAEWNRRLGANRFGA